MNLTTKGRYAVMAMVDLALHGARGPITLAEIASRQNIAVSYLEQIFMKLRKSGLVTSVRGPGGGYIISNNNLKIKVAEIVCAVDESIKMTRCRDTKSNGCMHGGAKCRTHNLWEGLSNRIFEYLDSITLADLCKDDKQAKLIREEVGGAHV